MQITVANKPFMLFINLIKFVRKKVKMVVVLFEMFLMRFSTKNLVSYQANEHFQSNIECFFREQKNKHLTVTFWLKLSKIFGYFWYRLKTLTHFHERTTQAYENIFPSGASWNLSKTFSYTSMTNFMEPWKISIKLIKNYFDSLLLRLTSTI